MEKPDMVFVTNQNSGVIQEKLKSEKGIEICNACRHVIIGPHDCQAVDDAKEQLEGSDDASEKPEG